MSDFDLDGELLALAGDGNAGDDVIDTLDGPSRSRSPTPPKETIEDKSPPSSQPRRGVASKRKTAGARGGPRRGRKDESEDEGEA